MAGVIEPSIEAYAESHTTPPAAHLQHLAEETKAELGALSGMMVGALEGRFLEMMVFASRARRILEIGTFTGYSSLSMAAALPPDGLIVTCEVSERHADIARRHIAASPHADRIELRFGPALESIARLEGPFDLVFIDADKRNYLNYFEAVLPKLTDSGLIMADNTLWSGRVIDQSDQSEDTAAIRQFNERVAADPRVVCVQLTVRDGVTLIRKAG
ncbi:MAG TPA: class I SAM-dependent methyltransferase [Acidimicrobiales bacterium]|nr:class I SAM-dependent methyltransferase [Acidimicrobiales bacterium]